MPTPTLDVPLPNLPSSTTDYKLSVKCATTGNVGLFGGAPNIVDGQALTNMDRVLVKDQTKVLGDFSPDNGIYVVWDVGTGIDGTWVRAQDFNTNEQATPGALVYVETGDVNGQKFYALTSSGEIILDVTGLRFSEQGKIVLEGYAGGSVVRDADQTRIVIPYPEATSLLPGINSTARVTVNTGGTYLQIWDAGVEAWRTIYAMNGSVALGGPESDTILPDYSHPTPPVVFYAASEVDALLAALHLNQAISVTTGGTTTLTAAAGCKIKTYRVSVGFGVGLYTHNLVLDKTDRLAGDIAKVCLSMPASSYPTIGVKNWSGSSLIGGGQVGNGVVEKHFVECEYDGVNWNLNVWV